MIFLRYRMRIQTLSMTRHDSDFDCNDMDQVLKKECFDEIWLGNIRQLIFSTAGQDVLSCTFSSGTVRKDRICTGSGTTGNEKFQEFAQSLISRIESELMKYERQEFEFKEIEL